MPDTENEVVEGKVVKAEPAPVAIVESRGPWTLWVEKPILGASAIALIIAGFLRIARVEDPDKAFNHDTLLYFVAAGVVVLLNRVKKVVYGDNSIELSEQVQALKRTLEEGVGGKPARLLEKTATKPTDPDDPNKGAFGGDDKVDGLKLWAKVQRIPNSRFFRVRLEVTSIDERKPLTEDVQFVLHPTFNERVVVASPKNGRATIFRTAYGAFTVGAVVTRKGVETRLELDLADANKVPDAPPEFRAL